MNQSRQYIDVHRTILNRYREAGDKVLGDPLPVYDFMAEYGHEWIGGGKPERYKWRTPNWCFGNSWQLARRSVNLAYVEGYAYQGLIPVHHAWCVNVLTGEIVDTTWNPRMFSADTRPVEKWEYFGVPFNTGLLDNWMKSKVRSIGWSVLYHLRYDEEDFGIGLTREEIIAKVEL